jgi:hypothetical protein
VEREKKFRKTFEIMERLGQAMPITGIKRPNTGQDDDDDDVDVSIFRACSDNTGKWLDFLGWRCGPLLSLPSLQPYIYPSTSQHCHFQ